MKNLWLIICAMFMTFGTGAVMAEGGMTLAQESGCLSCHKMDSKLVGPSFKAIAERYADTPEMRQNLFDAVRNGGQGNWTKVTGGVAMPPNKGRVSDEDIKRLVGWVLDL